MSKPGDTLVDLDFGLYHWSPTSRRKQIERYGFRPSMRSLDGAWKPPYVCFSDTPHLAWQLSGRIHPEVKEWDLWMTWSSIPSGMESILEAFKNRPGHYIKEYRVYERIYKRDIWYVASRLV
jgi:hypothetical protein